MLCFIAAAAGGLLARDQNPRLGLQKPKDETTLSGPREPVPTMFKRCQRCSRQSGRPRLGQQADRPLRQGAGPENRLPPKDVGSLLLLDGELTPSPSRLRTTWWKPSGAKHSFAQPISAARVPGCTSSWKILVTGIGWSCRPGSSLCCKPKTVQPGFTQPKRICGGNRTAHRGRSQSPGRFPWHRCSSAGGMPRW